MLLIVRYKDEEKRLKLAKEKFIIGRENSTSSPDYKMDKNDASLSRTHAILKRQPNGRWLLEDTSKRGTQVKGKLVLQNIHPLVEGDIFEIGDYHFSLQSPQTCVFRSVIGAQEKLFVLPEEEEVYLGRDEHLCTIVPNLRDYLIAAQHISLKFSNNQILMKNLSSMVYINKQMELDTNEHFTLSIGDVFQVGNTFIQVLPKNKPMLQCKKYLGAEKGYCGLFNEYQHESNCRWCGSYLGDADTVVARSF